MYTQCQALLLPLPFVFAPIIITIILKFIIMSIMIIMFIIIIMIIMTYIRSARHIVSLWCLFCPALPLRYQTPPLSRFWESWRTFNQNIGYKILVFYFCSVLLYIAFKVPNKVLLKQGISLV